MRIGIFGGSFNPPHNGHLHLANSVHDALQLDEVLLVPAKQPPHKSASAYAPAEDRLAMCRLAAEEYPWMRAEDYELRQNAVSYSYYTVTHFAKVYPDAELFLLIGGDMLRTFTQWYRFQDILRYAALAAIAREPEEYANLQKCADELRQYGEIHLLNVETISISSTKIRENVKKSQNNSCYLPEKIVQYIKQRNLYAGSDDSCIG
ncbi:MAG: nicotinate (nicotinamide) nucleotide adenylyltransferase [Ruminococcus sp.]|nr:nicotinate (nicotinamide) nucleotide adenylyltransferase [Ruminococcus sp.]